MHRTPLILILFLLGACSAGSNAQNNAIAEVSSRELVFPTYPEANKTYLSFSRAHGFQVNYLQEGGRAWLWYPGNRVGLPELWRVDNARAAICWRHPSQSYNPVTKRHGGRESCAPLALARRTIVSVLPGDPFKLRTGKIPYVRQKCAAPDAFAFDRTRFKC